MRRGVFGAAALVGVDAFLIEPAWLEGVEIQIPIKGLPEAFEGYRIGQVSDIHWPWKIDRVFLDHCWETVMAMKPDVICATGDFLESRKMKAEVPFTGLYKGLSAPDGMFGVLGNHDYAFPDFVRSEMEKEGVRILMNESVILSRGGAEISLAGIEDLWYGRVDVDSALAGIPEDMPRILMSHNPDFAEDCPEGYRVDLQLSGHTHGGQLATPFHWAPYSNSQYGSRFLKGLAEGKRHRVYTNRGITRGSQHWRLCTRPEVTVIELVRG